MKELTLTPLQFKEYISTFNFNIHSILFRRTLDFTKLYPSIIKYFPIELHNELLEKKDNCTNVTKTKPSNRCIRIGYHPHYPWKCGGGFISEYHKFHCPVIINLIPDTIIIREL